MSEETAMSDTILEDPKLNGDKVTAACAPEVEQATLEPATEPPENQDEKPLISSDVVVPIKKEEDEELPDEKHGIKRRASLAFSDIETTSEEFKGFEEATLNESAVEYSRILERIEAEVIQASKEFAPVKIVTATPIAIVRPMKRPRQDTDGSRPSSALSSRSESDGFNDAASTSSSPSGRRRTTVEVSSPLLRVPLEHGWRRELVYRAALDAHARRNADIYYYTPQGKKLRSTREIAEHLSGTGLTLENFSFFKEPLGVDDPEKEIIRDAKVIRRVESPVSAPAPVAAPSEAKRVPKPKAPKGASPDPPQSASALKSPPTKIKVKSLGSRLSNNGGPASATKQQPKRVATTTMTTTQQQQNNSDNNNTAAWKKPRQPPPPPPPLQSRPPQPAPAHHLASPDAQSGRQLVQPCSMSCGRGAVPSLACGACLCLYHPACVGYSPHAPPERFLCKNCRKSSSPPLEPPPLTHKSGVTAGGVPLVTPVPRRVPVPVPVPVPAKVPRQDKRVLLRMKVAGGGPDGERVWAVTKPLGGAGAAATSVPGAGTRGAVLAGAGALPQSIAVLNGRRFIVVPRSVVQGSQQ